MAATKVEYPSWAPQAVVLRHGEFIEKARQAAEGSPCVRNARILGALTMHANMQRAWKALESRAGSSERCLIEAATGSDWHERFAVAVLHAAWPLAEHEDAAASQQRQKLAATAKHLRAAADAMRTFCDWSYFSPLHQAAPTGSEREEKLLQLTGQYPLLFSISAQHVHGIDLRLSEVLTLVAQQCDSMIEAGPLVHGAKSERPEVVAFVRRLSVEMSERFGTPLHEHVALIADAIYDFPGLDQNKVRLLCKTTPGRKRARIAKLPTGAKSSRKRPLRAATP